MANDVLINVFDFERAARERLSEMVYGYLAGGSEDELALRANRAAFEAARLLPRVLRGVGPRSLATTVLGQHVGLPVLVAPAAFQRVAHPDGELAVARAAKRAGTVMILSALTTVPLEEVCRVGGSVWFQLFVYQDRGANLELIRRAEAAGCAALVVTVDAAAWGKREAELRTRFYPPEELVSDSPGSSPAPHHGRQFKHDLAWSDIEWLLGQTRLPVVLKGILHPEDARLAAGLGVGCIVVSNHGGRQLDAAPATLELLPRVAEAVGGAAELIVDGGVRRGGDVLKAVALGARAVAVARPVLWGLAVEGERGVSRVLGILRDELDTAMALCGCASLNEVTPDLIHIASA